MSIPQIGEGREHCHAVLFPDQTRWVVSREACKCSFLQGVNLEDLSLGQGMYPTGETEWTPVSF